MERSRGDAGFSLVEVTIGAAVVSLAATGWFLAAGSALRAETQARSVEAIAGAAEDTVIDLRTIAAYDPAALAPIADGLPKRFNGTNVTVSPAGAGAYDLVVAAGSGERTIAIKTRLSQEAPPPGALIAPQAPLEMWSPPGGAAPPARGPTPQPCPPLEAGPRPLERLPGPPIVPCGSGR